MKKTSELLKDIRDRISGETYGTSTAQTDYTITEDRHREEEEFFNDCWLGFIKK